MDTDPQPWHSMEHETTWNRCTARKSETKGDGSLTTGKDISLCSISSCFIPELCGSLVRGLPQEWAESSSAKTNPGTASSLTQGTDTPTESESVARPRSFGYSTELWTLQRIALLIEKEFGVHYHIGHVWKLMSHELGWSCQKPERRATERDEEAIERWKKKTWPAIKKNRTT